MDSALSRKIKQEKTSCWRQKTFIDYGVRAIAAEEIAADICLWSSIKCFHYEIIISKRFVRLVHQIALPLTLSGMCLVAVNALRDGVPAAPAEVADEADEATASAALLFLTDIIDSR